MTVVASGNNLVENIMKKPNMKRQMTQPKSKIPASKYYICKFLRPILIENALFYLKRFYWE